MNPYIYIPGVSLWTRVDHLDEPSAASITILDHTIEEIDKPWQRLEDRLLKIWPFRFKWHTSGYGNFHSKSEEYIALKDLKTRLSTEDFYKKNTNTGVYSYIKKIELGDMLDINEYTYPSHTALVFLKSDSVSPERLWEDFSPADKNLEAKHILKLSQTYSDMVVCLFSESDIDASVQIITAKENSKIILEELKKENFFEIPEGMTYLYVNEELDVQKYFERQSRSSTSFDSKTSTTKIVHWNDLEGSVFLNKIFTKKINIGKAILHSFNIENDRPGIRLELDIKETPDSPPKKWEGAGFNTCRMMLSFWGVSELLVKNLPVTEEFDLTINDHGDHYSVSAHSENSLFELKSKWLQISGPSVCFNEPDSASN